MDHGWRNDLRITRDQPLSRDAMENEIDRQLSTRVNAARLESYAKKTIRLPCKVLFVDGTHLLVEASDGGQVKVIVPSNVQNEHIKDAYVEVLGRVQDSATVTMTSCIGLGAQLDMKLVNDVIELAHDPRFIKLFI